MCRWSLLRASHPEIVAQRHLPTKGGPTDHTKGGPKDRARPSAAASVQAQGRCGSLALIVFNYRVAVAS